MPYDYVGTPGDDTANHASESHATTWDFSQGGNDTLTGSPYNDTFYFGAELTADDRVVGSPSLLFVGGTVELAGNYWFRTQGTGGGTLSLPYQLVLAPNTLVNVQGLQLDEGSSFGYDIVLPATNFNAGFSFLIDASRLTTAPETIDGSLSTAYLTFYEGTGTYDLIGGTAGNIFYASFVSGDTIDGGSGGGAVRLSSINGGGTLSLPDPGLRHIHEFDLEDARLYTITIADGEFSDQQVLTVKVANSDATLNLSASAVTSGALDISGRSNGDTLNGGGGNDTLDASDTDGPDSISGGGGDDVLSVYGSGSQTVSGGAGNDTLTVKLGASIATHIDGGIGHDTLNLIVQIDQTTTITPAMVTGIETLNLSTRAGSPDTDSASIVWQNGILSAGQVLSVATSLPVLSGLNVVGIIDYDFDGSAETHGSFVFALPFGSEVDGNHWTGGSGNDVFLAAAPVSESGHANVWDGGGGTNTLDYSGANGAMQIDAAAGTATGTASPVADQFSHFQVFKFNANDDSFTGSASAETIYMLGVGQDTIAAAGGNDVIYLGQTLDAADSIDGGANTDTVILDGDYSAGLTLNATTLANIETLRLQHLAGEPDYSYRITTADGTVAAGATLTVIAQQLTAAATVTFDGHNETDGHLYVIGGTGNDTLIGGHLGDTLNGGGGIDSLTGGMGNDAYFVDNAADRVIEATGGGTDTLFSSVSYTLQTGQSIDVLATSSQGGTGAINLAGNDLAQTIRGNAGDNGLTAGGGADLLYGFGGNDRYYVDNATERVFEVAGQGSDTVFASATYALQNGQSVELLATNAQGSTASLSLSGNDLAQRINGNEGINGLYGGGGNDSLYGYGGNDRLVGGAGHDVMDGGAGNDVFAFGAVTDSTGVTRDLIQNMNLTAADKFQFTVKPTAGIHAAVIHGSLNEGSSFDANLNTAIHDANQLDAHQAVLFTPDGGTLAHHVFLILDVNGTAGYQAGADYVVELQGLSGALTTDDFM